METKAKLEFDVEMKCNSCKNTIEHDLQKLGNISDIKIDVEKQSVTVETTLPYSKIQEIIEKTGRKAILKGFGSVVPSHLGAAVSEMTGKNGVQGVVRFFQADNKTCVIDGTIDNLPDGEHGLHICEYGDLSEGCDKTGRHYSPTPSNHGGPSDEERHYGDLGNVKSVNGRAVFRLEDRIVKVWDIIGRSLTISSEKDDFGKGNAKNSLLDGNSGPKIACGIIARSAGLFQNPKRICQCSGASIWDEREKAVAKNSSKE